MNPRGAVGLWLAQRASAAVLAVCVLVHIAVMVYAVRGGLSAGEIFVDMIVQSEARDGEASLSFTVPQAALEKSLKTAREVSRKVGCGEVTSSPRVAKLSVSGIGMRSHTGVAIRMFEALAQAGGILASEIRGSQKQGAIIYFMGMDAVRFRKPVVPGDQLMLEARVLKMRSRVAKMAGRALVDGQLVAEAELMASFGDSA